MKYFLGFVALALPLPAQAQIFICDSSKFDIEYKIEDGEWYQRPPGGSRWRSMNCGVDGNECRYGRSIHSFERYVGSVYSQTFIYENSGRWVTINNYGNGEIEVEGFCEKQEEEY